MTNRIPRLEPRKLAEGLRRSAQAFSDAGERVDADWWDRRVSPDSWSISDYSEHVVLTEEEIIPDNARRPADQPHESKRVARAKHGSPAPYRLE